MKTIIFFIYSFVLFLGFIVGIASPRIDCDGPKTRLEYLIPSYMLGCYLTKPLNDD